MPRPGPRPYECVRRAWHSDRHQPMRGSLIQEIFRIINDIHSSSTKKNKEWQEKLPIVVLKVEEIIYSKANSEAEYMDVKTLYDRANEAIDIIIRREESTETGDLLQPCIEAALVLGCTARRTSRSQRNSNPRCYLSPKTQEPSSFHGRVQESITLGEGFSNVRRPTTLNSTQCSSNTLCNNPAIHQEVPLSVENVSRLVGNQISSTTTAMSNPSFDFGHVYPVYYGVPHQATRPQSGFQSNRSSHSNTCTFDTPKVLPGMEPRLKGFLKDYGPGNASKRLSKVGFGNVSENSSWVNCDLSLRLGIVSTPCRVEGNSLIQGVESARSSSARENCLFADQSPQIDKEFGLFPSKKAYESS